MRRIVAPIGYAKRRRCARAGLFRGAQSDSACFARAIHSAFASYLTSDGETIPPEAKSLLLARIDHKVNQNRWAHKLAYPQETLRRDLEDARLHLASPAQCKRLLAAARVEIIAVRVPPSQRRDLRCFLVAVMAECQPRRASAPRAHPRPATDGWRSTTPTSFGRPTPRRLAQVSTGELHHSAMALVGDLAEAIHRATGRPLNLDALRLKVTTRAAQLRTPRSFPGRSGAKGRAENRPRAPRRPPTVGLARLHEALLSVADRVCSRAFYDPTDRSITLVLENMRASNEDQLRAVLLHELVHAWQYQHYPQLQTYEEHCREALRLHGARCSASQWERADLEDRLNSLHRLVEGHATLIEGTFVASRYPHAEHRTTALEKLVLWLDDLLRTDARDADWYVLGACRLSAVSERPQLLAHMFENPSLAEVLLRTRGRVVVQPTASVKDATLRAAVQTLFALNPDRGSLRVTVCAARRLRAPRLAALHTALRGAAGSVRRLLSRC
jgi:hypothetical protein